MTTMRRIKRPRRATRRLNMAHLKEALGLDGDMVFPCLGIVTDEDVSSHFELDNEDLLIEVELQPGGERITARMGVGGAGAGQGIWYIPPVGTEVIIIMCDGEFESDAAIIGVLSTGLLPAGIAEGTTIIANASKVLIHDGSGGTDQLVLKTAYAAHTHPTGTGPSGVPNNAASASSYSQILEAK